MTTSPAPLSAPLELGGGRLRRTAASPVLRFVARRLLAAIPVLWGVTFLTFLTLNALPGDTAQQLLGANATPQEVHALDVKLGLDRPFFARYGDWLHGVVTGSLGHSLVSGESVTSTLLGDLPVTFELLLYAFLLSVVFAMAIALFAARRPGGIFDRVSMLFTIAGLSIAPYVLALVLIYVFAVRLNVLPALGWVAPGDSIGGNIRSLTLPAVTLGLALMCFYARLLRADLVQQLSAEDYVVTARAKGAGPWRVILRHALRNSLFGLITVVALNLGTLLGVTVIVEQIFGLPGIGRELLSGIDNRDIPMVEGAVLVFAVVVVLANLLADFLYSVLDPRVRYGDSAG